jgi:tetratricopeptide (TPR) repeat protein
MKKDWPTRISVQRYSAKSKARSPHFILALIVNLFLLSSAWAVQREDTVYLQIIASKTPDTLNRVSTLLKEGRDFSALAQEYSTHSTAREGGVWGPLRLDQLPQVVRDRVENAEAEAVIQVFDPALGHAIIRRLSPPTARKILFQLSFNRGAADLQRNDKDEALKEMKRAVALDPQSAAAHQLLGQAYMLQGTYEMIGEAKAEFVQALALDSNLVWARFYLARLYLDQGLPQKAKDQLEAALKMRPDVPHLLSLLGEANRKLGNVDLSIELNRKALAIDPSFFVAHYYLGLAYTDLKRQEDAISELEAAVKAGYPAAEIYLALGTAYFDRGNWERAYDLFQQAVVAAPARPEGHLKLAQALVQKHQLDRALKELDLAYPEGRRLLSTPYYQELGSQILFERGRVYEEKGARMQAMEAYSRALELDPNQTRALERIKALQRQ